MNNELNSVEDIDAMLDSQFNITDEEPNDNAENTEETDGNVENQETSDDGSQETGTDDNNNDGDENNSNETENKSDSKPSADDKKEFAFSKIRKENSDLKNQLNEKNEQTEFLNKLAAQYGYTDVKKFQADYEKASHRALRRGQGDGVHAARSCARRARKWGSARHACHERRCVSQFEILLP